MPDPTARDVILACLAQTIPATDRPDVEDRADLIVAALVQHGHLPQPHVTGLSDADADQIAEWLGNASQFARYTSDDLDGNPGWHRILDSDADVNVAAAKALMLAPTDSRA